MVETDKNKNMVSIGSENGLLSDIEILERLVAKNDKLIFISPLVNPLEQLGPCSLDLRLGTELRVARNIYLSHLTLRVGRQSEEEKQLEIEQYFESRHVDHQGKIMLHPGEFALASTLEYIKLPNDIAGRLEGRSSMGRLGLQIHATAGFVDPGFYGSLTYELINSGKLPIEISPGFRLGQICFYKVDHVQVNYTNKKSNKYSGRLGVDLSRYYLDSDVPK